MFGFSPYKEEGSVVKQKCLSSPVYWSWRQKNEQGFCHCSRPVIIMKLAVFKEQNPSNRNNGKMCKGVLHHRGRYFELEVMFRHLHFF